jgi:hypothetical protein
MNPGKGLSAQVVNNSIPAVSSHVTIAQQIQVMAHKIGNDVSQRRDIVASPGHSGGET